MNPTFNFFSFSSFFQSLLLLSVSFQLSLTSHYGLFYCFAASAKEVICSPLLVCLFVCLFAGQLKNRLTHFHETWQADRERQEEQSIRCWDQSGWIPDTGKFFLVFFFKSTSLLLFPSTVLTLVNKIIRG